MVGLNPAPLTSLAADAYFQAFYNSKTCVFFVENSKGSVSFDELDGSLEDMFSSHMKSLKWKVLQQMNYFKNMKNLEILKKYFKQRSNGLVLKGGEVLLSFYISDTVIVYSKYRIALQCLAYIGIKNLETKTLRSADFICKDTLRACTIIFPRLKYLHIRVKIVSFQILRCINEVSSHLEVMCIISEKSNVTNEELCIVFFRKRDDEVRESYRNCIELKREFDKLRYFHLPVWQMCMFDFLKFFLHYYPKVDIMSLNSNPLKTHDLTMFDGILCYTIDMNPFHALHVCNLLYADLRFPYLEDCISKWVNLDTLTMLLKKFERPLDHNKCSKTLSSILKNNKNITHFTLTVDSDECVQYLKYIENAVEGNSDSIIELRLVPGKIRVSDVIKFVNCFPSLKYLYIDVHMRSSNSKKETKFKHLSKLDTLNLKVLGSQFPDGLRLLKALFDSTKNLKHFNCECIGAFIFKLDIGFLPLTVETFSLVLICADEEVVKSLCSHLMASNLKEFRFGIHFDYPIYYTDPSASLETKHNDILISKFSNSSLTLRCEDTLTIYHARFDESKLLKNLKYY